MYLLFLVSPLGSMLLLIAGVPALACIPAVVGITNVVSVPSVANFLNINGICSTTGKPTHLFRTKCASLDSV